MQYTFPGNVADFVDTGIFIRADGSRAMAGVLQLSNTSSTNLLAGRSCAALVCRQGRG